LLIEFDHKPDRVRQYRRELDLTAAIARTTFTTDDVTFTREVFASFPDQVLVVRISADRPGNVSFTARLRRPERSTPGRAGDDLEMSGQLDDGRGGGDGGMKYLARLRAIADGGSVRASEEQLTIREANAVTLLLAAGTDYANNYPPSAATTPRRASPRSSTPRRSAHFKSCATATSPITARFSTGSPSTSDRNQKSRPTNAA
jgi:alpha-L-fucosidase 2